MRYGAPVTDRQDTCWTMVRAAANGDTAARSAFSRSYASTVRSFLASRWRGSSLDHAVDDAAQEVMIECIRPSGVLESADANRGDFRGLLYGVSRNVARRFEERAVEHARIRPQETAWLESLVANEAGQSTLFDRNWAHTLVHEAKSLFRRRAEDDDDEAALRRVETPRATLQ